MSKRKYITEYGMAYSCTYFGVLTAHQLALGWELIGMDEEELNKCHIYVITSRPNPYFIKSSVVYEDNKISGEIGYRVNGEERRLQFSDYPFELSDGGVVLRVSEYPHREIWTYNDEGEKVRYVSATYLASIYGGLESSGDLNTFRVLYIGQAFGQGNRTAQDRLASHATLQKILARTNHDRPDDEINIFLLQFERDQVISTMDGRAKEAINTDENEERLMRAIGNPPSKKQKISMVEAALIRYFQPEYNEIFKIKFPSTKLKTLRSCMDLDVSGLIVELDTSVTNFYLYSDVVESSTYHSANYDFVSHTDRESFFNAGGITLLPKIIKAES